MGSFRPIQPAPLPPKPLKRGAPSDSTTESDGSSDRQPMLEKRAKRFKSVTQACNTCRRYKARCDGARPRCGACSSKSRTCGYEGEEGQSRQAAKNARLAALEELVRELQTKPAKEAELLLQNLRSADDILGGSKSGSDSHSTTGSSDATPSDSTPTGPPTLTDATTSQGAPPTCAIVSQLLSSQLVSARLQPEASAYMIRLIIPSAELTRAALQSFYSSSGRLFHVFSGEQIDHCFKAIFGLDGHPKQSQKVAICCVASVAAVGVQYNPGDFDPGSDRIFYDIARHCFVDLVEERHLDAIKVCTMLAMYNILTKATIALGYVGEHLYSLAEPDCLLTPHRRTRRVRRLQENMANAVVLVELADVETDFALVQSEMTRISLLKAEILRTHLSLKELTAPALNSALEALEKWHKGLPRAMRLEHLHEKDLEDIVRRSLFHVHLLYLGAHILLYRRIASQLIQKQRPGSTEVVRDEWEKTLLSHAEKGITAAKHSARILGLLLAEQGIFKRCWLVIFQSHTSCVAILHSVAQKQLHKFPPSSWVEDLKQAQLCLDALEFCGTVDPVALRFHVRLSGIYRNLANASPSGLSAMQRTEEWVSLPPDFPPFEDSNESSTAVAQADTSAEYLLTIPPDADPRLQTLCIALLHALCRPWSDAKENLPGEKDQPPLSPKERQLQIEKLKWDMGSSVLPFKWDATGLGVMNPAPENLNCFMGSDAPSGWSPADDVEVYDDE
ncbi:hypothetical protein OQA88_4274 [Cercophora sp. LCS_1]